jgi:ketosteroid isomerase-like protein
VPEENVELVRAAWEAWERGDTDVVLSFIDPDVEWLTAIDRGLGRAGSVYHGHTGMRELWNLWRVEFDDFSIQPDAIRDLGDERILSLAHWQFRGRASGVMVESQLALLMTVRDGKIVRSEDYLSHEEALKAVGLEA